MRICMHRVRKMRQGSYERDAPFSMSFLQEHHRCIFVEMSFMRKLVSAR